MKKSTKSLVSKSLLFKEWQTAKWSLVVMAWFIFLLMLGPFIAVQGNIANKYQFTNEFLQIFAISNEYFLGVVVLISVLTLMLGSDKKHKKAFLYAMPFKRSQIIFNKLLMGIFTIISACLLNYIVVIVIYFLNKANLTNEITISQICNNFTKEISSYLLIFSYLMLMQTLTNNRFFGLFLSIFILVFFIPLTPIANFSISGGTAALTADTILGDKLFITYILLKLNDCFLYLANIIMLSDLARFVLAIHFYIGTILLYDKAKWEKSEGLIKIAALRKVINGLVQFTISSILTLVLYVLLKISNSILLLLILIDITFAVNYIWNKIGLKVAGRRKAIDIKKGADVQGMAKY